MPSGVLFCSMRCSAAGLYWRWQSVSMLWAKPERRGLSLCPSATPSSLAFSRMACVASKPAHSPPAHLPSNHLPSHICHLPSAFNHLPSTICLVPSAFNHLPSTVCLPRSAFYRLPSTICLLPSAFPCVPGLCHNLHIGSLRVMRRATNTELSFHAPVIVP